MPKCHFDYPKPLQSETTIIIDEADNDEPTIVTVRIDELINNQSCQPGAVMLTCSIAYLSIRSSITSQSLSPSQN